MNINKYDLIHKLEQMFDIDDVKDYDLNDDFILWGLKDNDDDGQFIWGEIISKDDNGEYGDVMFGFTYDKNDSLYDLADYILNEIEKNEKEYEEYKMKNRDFIKLLDDIIANLEQEKRHLIQENVAYENNLEVLDYVDSIVNAFREEELC
jgi:hypothetical protein